MSTSNTGEQISKELKHHLGVLCSPILLTNVLSRMGMHILKSQVLMSCDQMMVLQRLLLITDHEQVGLPSTGSCAAVDLIKKLGK